MTINKPNIILETTTEQERVKINSITLNKESIRVKVQEVLQKHQILLDETDKTSSFGKLPENVKEELKTVPANSLISTRISRETNKEDILIMHARDDFNKMLRDLLLEELRELGFARMSDRSISASLANLRGDFVREPTNRKGQKTNSEANKREQSKKQSFELELSETSSQEKEKILNMSISRAKVLDLVKKAINSSEINLERLKNSSFGKLPSKLKKDLKILPAQVLVEQELEREANNEDILIIHSRQDFNELLREIIVEELKSLGLNKVTPNSVASSLANLRGGFLKIASKKKPLESKVSDEDSINSPTNETLQINQVNQEPQEIEADIENPIEPEIYFSFLSIVLRKYNLEEVKEVNDLPTNLTLFLKAEDGGLFSNIAIFCPSQETTQQRAASLRNSKNEIKKVASVLEKIFTETFNLNLQKNEILQIFVD